jgi:uncharacterized protein YjiS (DUF1127 family)
VFRTEQQGHGDSGMVWILTLSHQGPQIQLTHIIFKREFAMSNQNAVYFMIGSADQSHDALMRHYHNEDYVENFDKIHLRRSIGSRWPFAQVRRIWQDRAAKRHLRLSIMRLGSLSSHLLDDIGIGSFLDGSGDELVPAPIAATKAETAPVLPEAMTALAPVAQRLVQTAPVRAPYLPAAQPTLPSGLQAA